MISDETYAFRLKVAAESRADMQRAIDECGTADAYCKWTLIDKLGIEPPRVTYGCRRDGSGWSGCAWTDERITDPSRAFVVKGTTYYLMRWESRFQAIELYTPQTREQLAAAAAARVARAAEAVAREPQLRLPL